jgi:hypothetical protein
VDDHDALARCANVCRTSNTIPTFEPHFPNRPFEMFYVRLTQVLQTFGFDKPYNAQEPRAHIHRQRLKLGLDGIVQETRLSIPSPRSPIDN